ncbi:MAG: hypothetical protein NTW17_02575 [Candidatus Pacearchaeota archaeon]|nr:hypothetical protein [Candidatus Pacearchaeota archaeon]
MEFKDNLIDSKRAFLLAEETLKIIVAVIAIGFLVFFLVSLYLNSINAQNLAKATASLGRIKEVIQNPLSTDEVVSDITPPGWVIFTFIGEKKPNSCGGETCLCICENIRINLFDRQIKECDSGGVCEVFDNLQGFDEISIKKPSSSIEIIKSEGVISIREK